MEIRRTADYIIVATRKALIKHAEFIEELNRIQLSFGIRSDDTLLPSYSPVSVEAGKPPGRIKLFDQGEFYEGINVSIFDDELRFEGEDEKTPMLISKYGRMILGLNDKSLQVLIDRIKPDIVRDVKQFYKRI